MVCWRFSVECVCPLSRHHHYLQPGIPAGPFLLLVPVGNESSSAWCAQCSMEGLSLWLPQSAPASNLHFPGPLLVVIWPWASPGTELSLLPFVFCSPPQSKAPAVFFPRPFMVSHGDCETLEVKTLLAEKSHPWPRLFGTSVWVQGSLGAPREGDPYRCYWVCSCAWMTWSCEPLGGKCLGDAAGGVCGGGGAAENRHHSLGSYCKAFSHGNEGSQSHSSLRIS